MWSGVHAKVLLWLLIIVGLSYFIYRKWEAIAFRSREIRLRVTNVLGGHAPLNSSFTDDIESGLHSRNFDILSSNSQDSRAGLDDTSKNEIKAIMTNEHISFDKARLIYTERKFGKNEIAPDGTPLDPKAVTFSR